jgi:signal transduction histidine kinase
MKRKTTKAIAWVLLAVCIFMAGKTLITTVDDYNKKDMNAECLIVKDYKGSNEFLNLGWSIVSAINRWQQDPNTTPDFQLTNNEFEYYATVGSKSITNTAHFDRAYFQGQSYYYVVDIPENGVNYTPTTSFRMINGETIANTKLYFSISNDTVTGLQQKWSSDRDVLVSQLLLIAMWGIFSVGLVVYLYLVAGRKQEDDDLHLLPVDRWFTEIYLIFAVVTWALILVLMRSSIDFIYMNDWQELSLEARYTLTALGVTVMLLSVMFSLPMIRKLKAHTFVRSSLIYRALRWGWLILKNAVLGVKGFFDGSAYKEHLLTKRLFRSQLAYICGSAGLLLLCVFLTTASGSFFPVFLFMVFEILITAWYVMGNKKAYSDINAGYVESLKSQMKSENTKTALITNVSHDLKTPLTSIITYVDLLAKEEGLSETSRDYVNIIAGKAERLKHIVSDLFDLSKSVSGNIPMELDILDLKTLMEQTLADMKEPIEGSGHGIKVNLESDTVNIFSDGKKLYRVFQNIIDNALKYSLAGSRVFIDLKTSGGRVTVTVKNTAGYEMDFTEEEILQRFTRGDEARTGEGSGLGLSIAESFTQSCGGTFKLDIDGDQFKVIVTFPIVEVSGRIE